MKQGSFAATLAFVFLLQTVVSLSHAQEPYYKGKTIRFLVNFSAGGPTDIFGRLIARYFPKYVAGNPSVTVQNMAGAGGIIVSPEGGPTGAGRSASSRACTYPRSSVAPACAMI